MTKNKSVPSLQGGPGTSLNGSVVNPGTQWSTSFPEILMYLKQHDYYYQLITKGLAISSIEAQYLSYVLSNIVIQAEWYFGKNHAQLKPDMVTYSFLVSYPGKYYCSKKKSTSAILSQFTGISKVRNEYVVKTVQDIKDGGSLLFPKGTVLVQRTDTPFPDFGKTDYSDYERIRALLDPDNYGASRQPLDFVNDLLSQALPNEKLWVVALDFDNIDIINLNTLSHLKRY